MIWMILTGVLVVVVGSLFIGSAYLQGYLDVKTRPREAMAWCHKHGHFRKGLCLPLGDTLYCPQCYLMSINNADNHLKKK